MKALVAFLLLATASLAANAPDTISGKVYRESSLFVSVRSSGQKTIIFEPDGRFTFLKSAGGGALILSAPFKIFLAGTHSDGTYTYQRTGDDTATVTLHNATGPAETMLLAFTSPVGGGIGNSALGENPTLTFSLSDLAEAKNAPTRNLSVRGRVEPGHPLIVGFVVPGDPRPPRPGPFVPPPGFRQREVVIRAVGPSLASFGVNGVWADPDFQVFKGSVPLDANEVHHSDWSVRPFTTPSVPEINALTQIAFRKIFDYVGAFQLLPLSRDAADVLRLDPGAYTVVCNAAAGDAGGEAMIEVYFLP